MIAKRIAATILLFLSILVLPWWAVLPIFAVCSFLFPSYYEVLVGGFFMDFLYGTPLLPLMGFQFLFTIVAIGILGAALFARPRFRVYSPRPT